MKTKIFFATILLFTMFNDAMSDIWVPPWGEMVSNDNQIAVLANDTSVIVDITTSMRIKKLINDDYLLNFNRSSEIGLLDPEMVEITGADSLLDQVSSEHALVFLYLSQTLLEDTLNVEIHTTYNYALNQERELPAEIYFYQTFFRTAQNSPWEEVIDVMPMFDEARYRTLIVSNVELSVSSLHYGDGYRREWSEPRTGNDITVEGEMIWDYEQGDQREVAVNKLGHHITLVDHEGYTDTITDEITYELTPERREVVPDIIIDEDVRISISAFDYGQLPDEYDYHMLAEIRLDPELAQAISPMWLWFPNDQVNAEVDLVGLFARGGWGHYPERWREDSLTVHVANQHGQAGFFIRIPQLFNPIENPNNVWFWSDPRLRIEISSGLQTHSSRFILITAPLQYSQIRFILPYWAEAYGCTSPFEHMEITPHSGVIFSGICREPGIAQIHWGYPGEIPPDLSIPLSFGITSVSPNPFNGEARISYGIDQPGDLDMAIFDQKGAIVHRQTEHVQTTGNYTREIDGKELPAGIYLLQIKLNNRTDTEKMVLIR